MEEEWKKKTQTNLDTTPCILSANHKAQFLSFVLIPANTTAAAFRLSNNFPRSNHFGFSSLRFSF
jgi:hypothetical protein